MKNDLMPVTLPQDLHKLSKMAHADIAGTILITQYANVKFKGKKAPEIPPQSLSCFDQTIPVPVN